MIRLYYFPIMNPPNVSLLGFHPKTKYLALVRIAALTFDSNKPAVYQLVAWTFFMLLRHGFKLHLLSPTDEVHLLSANSKL